jgi:hypothetical protein
MLAAQVNASKHDNLRMILGFAWVGGLGLCEALLGWVMGDDRGCSRWPCLRAILDQISTPLLCVLAGAVGPPCIACGTVVRWELTVAQYVFCAYGGPLSSM